MALPLRAPLLVFIAFCTCKSSAPSQDGGLEKPDPVLARGDGFTVRASAMQDRLLLENPVTRGELRDPARKRAFLDKVIDEELMLAEARRQGLDQSPEFKATVRTLLLQELRQARARARAAAGPVDAAQQLAEEQAWLRALRDGAKLQVDGAALDASVP